MDRAANLNSKRQTLEKSMGIGRISHIYGYSARYTFRPNQSWLYSLIKSGGY